MLIFLFRFEILRTKVKILGHSVNTFVIFCFWKLRWFKFLPKVEIAHLQWCLKGHDILAYLVQSSVLVRVCEFWFMLCPEVFILWKLKIIHIGVERAVFHRLYGDVWSNYFIAIVSWCLDVYINSWNAVAGGTQKNEYMYTLSRLFLRLLGRYSMSR